MKTTGNTILITGSTSGIGLGMALRFHQAGNHAFTEGLRVRLADTSVQVIELAPPGVRTALYGEKHLEYAMPLSEFLDEALTLLNDEPTPKEIIVERAKFLRNAVATGNYDNALGMLSAL